MMQTTIDEFNREAFIALGEGIVRERIISAELESQSARLDDARSRLLSLTGAVEAVIACLPDSEDGMGSPTEDAVYRMLKEALDRALE